MSPPHFVYSFLRKMFPMLHSIKWQNLIFWLALLIEILGNVCIAVICFLGCDAIDFKINLIFLVKPLLYMTKKSRKIWNILGTKRAFKVKPKAFFIIFKGLSVPKYCLRPEVALLNSPRNRVAAQSFSYFVSKSW